jgi:hypothetical protein
MPNVITDTSVQTDDIIAGEYDKNLSREAFVAQGAIVKGQILKTGTAGTQKQPIDAAGTGANAIALESAADGSPVWCLVRGPVTLKRPGLIYGTGANATQKAAVDVLLAATGMKVLTVTA